MKMTIEEKKKQEDVNKEIYNIIYNESQPSLFDYMEEMHDEGVIMDEGLLKCDIFLENIVYKENILDSQLAPLFNLNKKQIASRRQKLGILKTGTTMILGKLNFGKLTPELIDIMDNYQEHVN